MIIFKTLNMKILFVILTLALGSSYCFSQNKVPDEVKSKFATMYPNVGNAKWEIEDGLYEGSFKQNNTDVSVILSRDGSLIQTETEMDVNRLPQAVKDYVASKLGGRKISSAAQIVSADGTTTYEAEVDHTDYVFDVNGQLVNTEEKEEGEEDEDD